MIKPSCERMERRDRERLAEKSRGTGKKREEGGGIVSMEEEK